MIYKMRLKKLINQEKKYYEKLTLNDNIFLHALHNVVVQQNRDLESRVINALKGLRKSLHFNNCAVEFYLKEDNYLRLKYAIGVAKNLIPEVIERKDPVYERLKKRRITEGQLPFRKEFAEKIGLAHSLIVPTNSKGILIVSSKNHSFTAYQKAFLRAYAHSTLNFTLENAALYEQAQKEATLDGLTGLYNKRYLLKKLKDEYYRERRVPTKGLSVLMIDVDHFKRYNDARGHQRGDRALSTIARILSENTRRIDVVGRYGGEEFTVILPNTKTYEAAKIAENLRKSVENTFSNKVPRITLSIGVANSCDLKNNSYSELITLADKALYAAKKKRNSVFVY